MNGRSECAQGTLRCSKIITPTVSYKEAANSLICICSFHRSTKPFRLQVSTKPIWWSVKQKQNVFLCLRTLISSKIFLNVISYILLSIYYMSIRWNALKTYNIDNVVIELQCQLPKDRILFASRLLILNTRSMSHFA